MERQNSIKCETETHDNGIGQKYIFAGPLNLNKMQRQASTVMGGDIVLGQNDFEALYMLATNEDAHLTFQQIYEASWGKEEATDSLDYASSALENLILQVNQIGDEFMWIEHTPGLGYKFKTRWGRKWRGSDITATNIPDNIESFKTAENSIQEQRKPSRVLLMGTLIAGAGSLVAAVMLVLLLLYSTGVITPPEAAPLYIEVEDQSIPLAAPNIVD